MKSHRKLLCALALSLVAALVLPGPALAKGKGKGKKKGKARSNDPALVVPLHLEVKGIDLQTGAAVVLVTGPARPPEARHFVFTDDRQRRFLPSQGECQPLPPGEGGAAAPAKVGGPWRCRLAIARIYQRAALVGVTVSLRERTASAAADRVRSLWAEARARTPLPVSAERPRGGRQPWSGGPRPDGGELDRGGRGSAVVDRGAEAVEEPASAADDRGEPDSD